MKIADVLEGGIAGVTTLSLIQEALGKIDRNDPKTLLHRSDTLKQLQKHKKKGSKSKELYVNLAGELLGHAALFGLTGLGKNKNAVLRGGLVGALAGLAVAFLDGSDKDRDRERLHADGRMFDAENEAIREKVITVALYTAGGVLAGLTVKAMNGKKLKKSKAAKALKQLKKGVKSKAQ